MAIGDALRAQAKVQAEPVGNGFRRTPTQVTEDDPRKDLVEDSERWTKVLNILGMLAPEALGIAHGFRCFGTRIWWSKREARWKLYPTVDPTGRDGFETVEQYVEQARTYMVPHQYMINLALGDLPTAHKESEER